MNKLKEEAAFTLIEMMIVLLIISVLILITIPNVAKHSKSIDDKGCAAYVSMVQSGVESYKMENLTYPTGFEELVAQEYFPDTPQCPDGRQLSIGQDGKVSYPKKN